MYASITADIVSSTSLSKDSLVELSEYIRERLLMIECRYQNVWCRLVKGDSIECIVDHPEDSFEIALMIKAMVRAFQPVFIKKPKKFSLYGVRVAIGFGSMKTVDRNSDVMDGEAIYISGRSIANMSGRKRNSFKVCNSNGEIENLQIVAVLTNQLLNCGTSRQCETLFWRLLSSKTEFVSNRMKISNSGVTQNLKTLGWDAIEQALKYYRTNAALL